jgi:hypothetical protein
VCVLQHAWKLFDAFGLVFFFFLLLEIWIVFWFQFCDFQKTVLRNAFLQFFLLALWISSSLVNPSHAMATVFDCGSGMQRAYEDQFLSFVFGVLPNLPGLLCCALPWSMSP